MQQTRPQHHFEHVALELHFCADGQPAGAFEYLHVDVVADHLDHLRHQTGAVEVDIGDLVLGYRSVYFHNNEIGNNPFNYSFC